MVLVAIKARSRPACPRQPQTGYPAFGSKSNGPKMHIHDLEKRLVAFRKTNGDGLVAEKHAKTGAAVFAGSKFTPRSPPLFGRVPIISRTSERRQSGGRSLISPLSPGLPVHRPGRLYFFGVGLTTGVSSALPHSAQLL